MSLLGVRSKYGTLPVDTSFVSGGAIAAGTPVALSTTTGKMAQVDPDAVTAYGVALTAAAAADEAVAIVPGGDDIVFRFTYTGTNPGIAGIGDFYGVDADGQVDFGETTDTLFKLLAVGQDVYGTDYCDVVIPREKSQAQLEVG